MTRELDYTKLKRFSIIDDLEDLSFDLKEDQVSIIGQERAEKAFKFGLNIKEKGYNIFVSGLTGTGKMTFAKLFSEEMAKKEPTPPDLCYIYNFENPQVPKLMKLKAGKGKEFKFDMEELIEQLIYELPKTFESDDFEEQKEEIVKTYQEKRELIIKDITQEAKKNGFGVKMTNSGIYFMPIIENEIISEEDYDELSDEMKETISEKSDAVQSRAIEAIDRINGFEETTQKKVGELEYNIALFTVGRYMSKLLDKYRDDKEIIEYLSCVKEDILDNIGDLIQEETEESETLQNILPWVSKKSKDDFSSKYKVNLLIDHGETNCAPVIVDYNPTHSNLVGEIEFDSEYGNFTTDYMKIKPGLLHKANGGYLILQAQDVLANANVWETLKRVIRTKKTSIEATREYSTGITVTSIKPKPVEIDLKIILVGSPFCYELLYEYDDEFRKLFKIKAVFDYEMDYNKNNVVRVANFIKGFCKNGESCRYDLSAIVKTIEYSMRISESQENLSARFGYLSEILTEAAVWAKLDKIEIVTDKYIKKAIKERDYRFNSYEEKLGHMIDKNIIMLDTDGVKIAQINGLAVLDTGEYVFAKPTKITATTYVGKAGIINIEKEADMSGAIHDKGIEVLTGFLGQTYAQEFPLSLSCRVCFEQNYSGIDGDSASSTELYAILSSLSDVPIRQDIAVTGSVNQMGKIQAIGGANHKIESFFDLCKKRGLTGNQGVIIPYANKDELVLKDSIIDAVKEGRFHVYVISNIDEGIEILTGIPAGVKDKNGKYPVSSIHGKVMNKLKRFYMKTCEI